MKKSRREGEQGETESKERRRAGREGRAGREERAGAEREGSAGRDGEQRETVSMRTFVIPFYFGSGSGSGSGSAEAKSYGSCGSGSGFKTLQLAESGSGSVFGIRIRIRVFEIAFYFPQKVTKCTAKMNTEDPDQNFYEKAGSRSVYNVYGTDPKPWIWIPGRLC